MKQACRNIGAHLADFESAMEFNAVTARIGGEYLIVFGFVDFTEERKVAVTSTGLIPPHVLYMAKARTRISMAVSRCHFCIWKLTRGVFDCQFEQI